MTEQEKKLLLKDLCARLPYDIIVEYGCKHEGKDLGERKGKLTGRMLDSYSKDIQIGMSEVYSLTPYLRPMSSMTEEEILHIQTLVQNKNHELYSRIEECGATGTPDWKLYEISYIRTGEEIDYLNSRHLDWRGLIEKGLALEAPKDMYAIK